MFFVTKPCVEIEHSVPGFSKTNGNLLRPLKSKIPIDNGENDNVIRWRMMGGEPCMKLSFRFRRRHIHDVCCFNGRHSHRSMGSSRYHFCDETTYTMGESGAYRLIPASFADRFSFLGRRGLRCVRYSPCGFGFSK